MKRHFFRIEPLWLGLAAGASVSVLAGLAYVAVWRERGSLFYPFAALAFVGGPVAGGIVAALRAPERRRKAFFASGGRIFGLVFVLFAAMYVVLPQFSRTSVDLTAFRDVRGGRLEPPSHLKHTLKDGSVGVLVASDGRTDVVAVSGDQPPFPTTVFLVDRNDGATLRTLRFENDVIAASIDDGTLVIYNDKLGHLLDARTGEAEKNFLLIDNYGGLSESDRPVISRASTGHWYMETTAVLSAWRLDGRVWSRRHLTFDCVALGCYIAGGTREVTRLRRAGS
jgi:hypothetical protein